MATSTTRPQITPRRFFVAFIGAIWGLAGLLNLLHGFHWWAVGDFTAAAAWPWIVRKWSETTPAAQEG